MQLSPALRRGPLDTRPALGEELAAWYAEPIRQGLRPPKQVVGSDIAVFIHASMTLVIPASYAGYETVSVCPTRVRRITGMTLSVFFS